MRYWNVENFEHFQQFAHPELISESRTPGVFKITLRNWKLLDPLLYTMIEMSHAVFRGVQRSDFALEPSIFRRYALKKRESIGEKNNYIHRCYNHFIEAIRGRRGSLSKSLDAYNKFELWSLGRHFGVKNTLLDWSHSPYVCLFFAFSNWSDDGVRSLYCLKRNIIEDARKAGSESKEWNNISLTEDPGYNSLLFYRPLSDDNFRMIHQQGLFTVSRSHHTIEEWTSENYATIRQFLRERHERERDGKTKARLRTELNSQWVLLKIDIETNRHDRAQILKKLNRMNINYASLFPDLEGASLYANMQGDIRHY